MWRIRTARGVESRIREEVCVNVMTRLLCVMSRTGFEWIINEVVLKARNECARRMIGSFAVAFCLAILRTAKEVLNHNCATEVQVPWKR